MIRKMVLFAFCLTRFAFGKDIALSFDDAPRAAKGYLSGPARASALIEGLKKAKVKETVFFSISGKLDEEGHTRLESYARAGFFIANHSHNHPNFNTTSAAEYVQGFKTAGSILSKFATFQRWFRFPFLREGNEVEKRDAMRKALSEKGYINGYVTINNYDWYMDRQFQKEVASNPKVDLEKVKRYYINTLLKAVEYYDDMAIKHLGRSPKHVILLHENDLNALFISDLVQALQAKGWNIISPREAYTDSISSYATESVFKYNPGRIGEIAHDKGQVDGLWHEACDEEFLDKEFEKQVRYEI